MSTWNQATITTKGQALQAKLTAGETLAFTRVVVGTGTVPAAQLASQTAVTGIVGTLTIQSITYQGNATVLIPVLLTNTGVTTSYTAKQIGFYATDPDDGEILYAIAQDTTGEVIPTEEDSPGQTVEWQFTIGYGNASNVSITIDQAGVVTYSGGDARYSPISHASSANTYGVGSTSNYGHVKVTNGNGLSINGGTVSMGVASQSVNGAMSAGDKTKLDGVAVNANNYTHPNSGATAGTYRSVTVNAQGHVTSGSNPIMAVNQGGTGATDAAGARTNLAVPPISHESTGTEYGTGNASNYGHLRLSDSTTSTSGEAGGIAATPAAVKAAADAAAAAAATASGKAPTSHASSSTSYGVGSTSNYGHVKVTNGNGLSINGGTISMAVASQSATGSMSSTDKTKLDGVATGANNYTHPNSGATAGTYRSVTVDAQGHVTAGTNPTTAVNQGGTGATDAAGARANLGAAPISHASTATTYGVGTASNYGHVKLSNSTTSTSGEDGAIAATPAAVKAAADAAAATASGKAPTSHASTATTYGVGSTTNYGHVKVTSGNGLGINSGTISMGTSTDSTAGAMTSQDHQKLTALDSIILGKVTTEATTDARVEIYVSPSGNDINDGKSLGAQMRTLRAVVQKYGAQNRLVIHMADGIYTDTEALQISGGYVNIDSQSNNASNVTIKFPITFFDSRVYFNYITIDTSAFYTSAAVNLGTLTFRHSQFALTNCVIKGLTANIYGVFARFASVGYILNTTITHSSTGLMVDAGAVVTFLNSIIAATVTNGINANNSFISASGGTNSATTPQRKSGTGVIFNGGNLAGTTTNSLATATI